MAPRALLSLLVTLAASAVACSALLPFDPAGLPCDSTGQCLEGFLCREDRCVRPDGGDACGGCPGGQRCDEPTARCLSTSCDGKACPVNHECQATGDTAECLPLTPPALGHACASDDQCGEGRVCFKGSVPTGNGFVRTGACLEPCEAEGAACASAGARCRPFPLALDAGRVNLCVTDALLLPCTSESTCVPHGLTCAVFDHPARGPLTVCDAPLADAGALGEACVTGSGPRDAGQLCGNGLCAPRVPSAAPATCAQACDAASCPPGTTCQPVELGVEEGFPLRHVPMCVAAATTCADCASTPTVCGADAPHCTLLGAAPVCLAACTPGAAVPDGGQVQECPSGFECQALTPGPRCVPLAGCP